MMAISAMAVDVLSPSSTGGKTTLGEGVGLFNIGEFEEADDPVDVGEFCTEVEPAAFFLGAILFENFSPLFTFFAYVSVFVILVT